MAVHLHPPPPHSSVHLSLCVVLALKNQAISGLLDWLDMLSKVWVYSSPLFLRFHILFDPPLPTHTNPVTPFSSTLLCYQTTFTLKILYAMNKKIQSAWKSLQETIKSLMGCAVMFASLTVHLHSPCHSADLFIKC